MEGWQVVTANNEKIGQVVAVLDDYLIVEQGLLMKSRHPVPKTFAHLREDEHEVCVSIPKNLVHDSPKAGDDNEFDRAATAEYYGLASAVPDSPSEGYGESDPGEPAWSADRDAEAAGQLVAEHERARIRTGKQAPRTPSSPGLLGERKREGR